MIAEIERRGGMIEAIASGWAQQQIADASWAYQREVEAGERVIVGVNEHVEDEPAPVEIHRHREEVAGQQIAALSALRASRDGARVSGALDRLRIAAAGDTNLVPVLVESVKAYATIGEICGVLREVFGEHRVAQIY
jgi:methylmalonyl-CoA mutase N-terminal domain/subunit